MAYGYITVKSVLAGLMMFSGSGYDDCAAPHALCSWAAGGACLSWLRSGWQMRRRLVRVRSQEARRSERRPLTLREIQAMRPRLAELCRGYGIAELSVFGSVARGDAEPGSDVDLLYVRVPGNDLGMSYFALQEDLEELFGCPVDLIPKDGLHRVIRDRVLAGAQVLYAA